jgi:hypothetical protein
MHKIDEIPRLFLKVLDKSYTGMFLDYYIRNRDFLREWEPLINIMPKNKAFLRVVEKLGFYNKGLAYKYLKINGKWEDYIHMVLLNEKV